MTILQDSWLLTGRMMKHMTRSIDTIISVVIMPIMVMLAFVYIFGGAMSIPQESYKGFILPAILLFTIASGVGYTAFRLNDDVKNGVFDRFNSMPISRLAVLNGHVFTSVFFNFISTLVVLLVGILIGFRPQADLLDWLAIVGLILLTNYALSWIAVFFGLIAKSNESASVFSYLLLGLLFISSGFVPTGTLPKALQGFADHQPMTSIINSLRMLLTDGKFSQELLTAVIWLIGVTLIFQFLAIRFYYKKMLK
ncbi:ABC transporter permease [Candidatus Enterococcus clewellii]|uniref:Transport permease protein n=1 Tax=Candidatus Enterococcus clewellii TaxID=1834193 RepID=A0A242K6G8_9ENTE|nr:ABC transporter permease [Enterococcus sp. 9E7_DIV0242]OTP15911.1 hypothetical protein A5888_002125 [Enterococcus sp. 9E7_DIV0242]